MKTINIINPILVSKLRAYFASQPVLKAWVFGSFSRGEDTPESDIDIIVSFDPNAKVGILKHIAMNEELEALMQRDVDLVSEDSFLPWIEKEVEKDKILVYEREIA